VYVKTGAEFSRAAVEVAGRKLKRLNDDKVGLTQCQHLVKKDVEEIDLNYQRVPVVGATGIEPVTPTVSTHGLERHARNIKRFALGYCVLAPPKHCPAQVLGSANLIAFAPEARRLCLRSSEPGRK
jgi:hypothetical protein